MILSCFYVIISYFSVRIVSLQCAIIRYNVILISWWFYITHLTTKVLWAVPRGCSLHCDVASSSCRSAGRLKWRSAISGIRCSFTESDFTSSLVQTGQWRTINLRHSLDQELLSIALDTLSPLETHLHFPLVFHHKNHSPGGGADMIALALDTHTHTSR